MDVRSLMDTAQASGLSLYVADGKLMVNGDRTPVASEVLPLLRLHRAELLAHLTNETTDEAFADFEALLRRSGSALKLSLTDGDPILIVANNPDPSRRELSVAQAVQICRQWQTLAQAGLTPGNVVFDFDAGEDLEETER